MPENDPAIIRGYFQTRIQRDADGKPYVKVLTPDDIALEQISRRLKKY